MSPGHGCEVRGTSHLFKGVQAWKLVTATNLQTSLSTELLEVG
jgi:hypothetical protein